MSGSNALPVEWLRSRAAWSVALVLVLCAAPGAAAEAGLVGGTADTVAPVRAAVPSAGSLALLRTRAAGRAVRVWVGRDDYFELRGARFDSSAISFTGGYLHDAETWSDVEVSPLPSAIAWDRVDRVGVQRSHAGLGATAGAALAVYAAVHGANLPDPNWGYVGVVSLIPLAAAVGAGTGALLGQGFSRWPVVWPVDPGHRARP